MLPAHGTALELSRGLIVDRASAIDNFRTKAAPTKTAVRVAWGLKRLSDQAPTEHVVAAMRDMQGKKSAREIGELVKILLIDDDQLVRECVESLVGKSNATLQLTVADKPETGFAGVSDDDIDLVLLGVQRGQNVAKVVSAFHKANEIVPLVVLAATEQESVVLQALDAGAMGFINKDASARSLLRALRSVLAGGIHVPLSVLKARGLYNLRQDSAVENTRSHSMSFSDERRTAITRRMLRGQSNRAIAIDLRVPEALVREVVSMLLKAFAVTSRSELLLALACAQPGVPLFADSSSVAS